MSYKLGELKALYTIEKKIGEARLPFTLPPPPPQVYYTRQNVYGQGIFDFLIQLKISPLPSYSD